jgi:zinc protease
VEQARRQVLRYGVTQGEVEREAGEALHAWQIAAAAADSAPASVIANALVTRVDNNLALTDPAQDLAAAAAVYDRVDAAQVDAAMRELFRGAGPLVFLSSPQSVAGGPDALAQAVQDVESAPISPRVRIPRSAGVAWPYTSFGPPGVVVERREIADLQTSFIRFQNGVRLTVRPSTLSGGEILVQAAVGDGRLDLPRDRISAKWAADSGAIDAGGLRSMDRVEMRRALAASVYSFRFSTADDSFNLSGVTRPADLDTQLQVLAAYATAPGWRAGVFEHIQSLFAALLPQFEASPGGVLGDYVSGLLHDGDPRWTTPTMGDVAAARSRDLRALLERPLGSGAIEVTVVGDVTVDRAVQAVAATFGALPARPPEPQPPPDAYRTRFPAPTASPVVRYHGGHADQALALIAWPIGDAYARNPNMAEVLVLQRVLNNRLIERLRIADGATYTPQTGLEASRTFPDFGYLFAAASVSPAQTDLVFERTRAIAADLRAAPISADELERARKPALAALQRARETDQYWLTALSRAQTDPRRLDLIRAALPDLRAVTAADVQRAAQAYLGDEKAWKLVITPHPAPIP